jgi:cytochrome c556
MSTTPEANPATPAKPSAASRYLFVFLVGLVIGAIAVVMILRTVEAKKTWQDRYPVAVMDLFQAHVAQLKASTEANRCSATDILPHLQALRTVANDIEPAFGDLREDARFSKHASDLRAVLDSTLAAPPLNCAGVTAAAGKIGEACKACHQDFRG